MTIAAIDIGASSGRIFAGTYKNKKISIREVYRFENSMLFEGGNYYWDIDAIYNEIITGLRKCSQEFKNIDSVGIDTWAVDYVLINKAGEKIAPVFAYRDHRTDETQKRVFSVISKDAIYEKTGIQFLQFNTIYQLYEHNLQRPDDLKNTDALLMIPDYLNYLLCGKKTAEFTNATSTQLLNIKNQSWDTELIKAIGADRRIFRDVIQPGTILGRLLPGVIAKTMLKDTVLAVPATHDTGSAVAAVPAAGDNFAYISSGTWSLMGFESETPICNEIAARYNFTNEGGVAGTYRVLKNIMGLWIVQEIRRLLPQKIEFGRLIQLAEKSKPFKCLINPNDNRFLNPDNMIETIKSYCVETEQEIPENEGELVRCVLESLAFSYKQTLDEINELKNKSCKKIFIIGGGAKNNLLNQLTADITGLKVYAGPYEATAIGNIVVQLIALGKIKDIKSARKAIRRSFEMKIFKPNKKVQIQQYWEKFRRL